jgi:signal transduction histidine kinase/ActR/RegA family two-component response regulator
MAKSSLIDRFPQYRDKYLADLVADLHINEKSAMIGHAVVIWIVVGVKWAVLPHWALLMWGGAVSASVMARFLVFRRYQRRTANQKRDVQLHTFGIGACALAWSGGFLTVLPFCSSSDIPFLMMVIAVLSASAIVSLSARLKSYAIFSTLLVLPCVLSLFLSDNPDFATGTLALIFLVFCGSGVKRANQISQSAMIRRYQNSEIMRDLGQAKRQLQEAVRHAEAANAAKKEFLANVSHEIRTPMNGVLGMTDLVLETELNDDQRNCLDTARRSGTSLLRLIDDLLDFSKIEAGKMEMEILAYELRPLVTDLVNVHRVSGKAKAEILLNYADDVPAVMVGDPNRMRQVINNLLSNAVKFAPRGYIRLSVLRSEIHGEQLLELSVADDGVGIPPDRLNSIFESFTQADGSTTRNYGGTGLGLTISRKLVELMGGTLTVQSDVGVGSVFSVALPLVTQKICGLSSAMAILVVGKDSADQADALCSAGANAQAGQLDGELWNLARSLFYDGQAQHFLFLQREDYFANQKLVDAFLRHFQCVPVFTGAKEGTVPILNALQWAGEIDAETLDNLLSQSKNFVAVASTLPACENNSLRILVAEDHKINATIVRRMLESMGHQVEVAVDGQAAVDAFTQHGADLILMDLQMPIMGGHDACRAIRQMDHGKDIPILALTAHATAEERQLSMEAGMDDHVTKPFTRAQLTSAVQLWGTSLRNPEKQQ